MKFYISFLLISVTWLQGIAQERLNKTYSKTYDGYRITYESDAIRYAPFWSYNKKTGNWEKRDSDFIFSGENFKYIKSYKLEDSNRNTVYAFSFSGSCKYQELGIEGIVEFRSTTGFVKSCISIIIFLSEDQYLNLRDILLSKQDKPTRMEIKTYIKPVFIDDNETRRSIENYAKGGFKSQQNHLNILVRYQKVNNSHFLRFRLPSDIKISNRNFKNNYFEIIDNDVLNLYYD